jgi:integrase
MPRPRPPHLQRHKTRHGKFNWYVQVGSGPLIRIKQEYGTPEFDEAYRAALAATPTPKQINAPTGSLEWAWMLYRQSQAWLGLGKDTRKQRESVMGQILKENARTPISAINRKAIVQGIERRMATPFGARHFLYTLRGLFQWLVGAEMIGADPTTGVKVKKPKTDGYATWTHQEIVQYEARWPIGTRERLMLDVYVYTGLRRGDAARVGKQHVHNGVIAIQTEKTGEWVHIPVLDVLQRTLDASPVGDLCFIVTPKGKPYAKESLGNAFKVACVEAGILDKSAHGLRKAAATRAAENGATEAQLEAIFGWRGGKMAYKYTQAANRKRLAAQAMNKLET